MDELKSFIVYTEIKARCIRRISICVLRRLSCSFTLSTDFRLYDYERGYGNGMLSGFLAVKIL